MHLPLVFCKEVRVTHSKYLSLSGAIPAHPKATGPLQAVRSRNHAPLHHYFLMPKRGGVWSQTNLAAFKKCPVDPRWITSWLQAEHLILDAARAEYVKFRSNLS